MDAPHIEVISTDALDQTQERRPEPVDGTLMRDIAAMKTAFWQQVLPDDPAVSVEAVRAELLKHRPDSEVHYLIARCDGHVAGFASVTFTASGPNSDTASCTIEVAPEHRRQRVGTALLQSIVDRADRKGCSSLVPWGVRTDASTRFWDSFDFAEVQTSRRSRVAIADIDRVVMQGWNTSSAARERGYELKLFVGVCPEDLLERYVCALAGMHDAPTDDLDLEPAQVSIDDVRALQENAAALGSTSHVILALDAQGEAAGVTEVVVSKHTPHLVEQQVTATLVAHRRQGLGRWLKAAMYFHIIDQLRDAQLIETGNADSNAPMLALNDEMGFVPVLEYTIRQASVTDVAGVLAQLSETER